MPNFKDELSPAVVERLATSLGLGAPFVREACDGLERLELKARAAHIEGALRDHLGGDLDQIEGAIDAALVETAFSGWMLWPVGDLVAAAGLDQPERTFALLARITPRWTMEGAVRPLIDRHPAVAMQTLTAWARDPDEHVRRLASEGSRPRLPWSPRLRALMADPTPVLPLLDHLRDDASEYVRRSVANHLNDIAKDHPELALAVASRWRAEGGAHTDAVLRRALRTLVKAGESRALALLGFRGAVRLVTLAIGPTRVPIGGTVTITAVVTADEPLRAAIDYAVHHAGARGRRAPKVFKWTARDLVPGVEQRLERRHAFREVSIRRIYPGPHRVEVITNGVVLGGAEIDVYS